MGFIFKIYTLNIQINCTFSSRPYLHHKSGLSSKRSLNNVSITAAPSYNKIIQKLYLKQNYSQLEVLKPLLFLSFKSCLSYMNGNDINLEYQYIKKH